MVTGRNKLLLCLFCGATSRNTILPHSCEVSTKNEYAFADKPAFAEPKYNEETLRCFGEMIKEINQYVEDIKERQYTFLTYIDMHYSHTTIDYLAEEQRQIAQQHIEHIESKTSKLKELIEKAHSKDAKWSRIKNLKWLYAALVLLFVLFQYFTQ